MVKIKFNKMCCDTKKYVIRICAILAVIAAGAVYSIYKNSNEEKFIRSADEKIDMPVIEDGQELEKPGLININTADGEELSSLDGIGKTIAERITAYREEHGPFGCIEDIKNVKGIGEKLFEKIKDDITV